MKNKIIVPTDLTAAASQALKQATIIARKTKSSLTLLHVLESKTEPRDEIRAALEKDAATIFKTDGVSCEVVLREGNLFEVISYVACEKDFDLMVIGTHGIKGIKEMFLGADILKLVAKIPFPALVVQEETPLKETFQKIVLPVSSHDIFQAAIDGILLLASFCDIEVHLYSIYKAGYDWSENLIRNIEFATAQLQLHHIKMVRIKEDQTVYAMGYVRQTVKYANAAGCDAFCMISIPTEEHYYFAQSDKETMLTNEYHIPVLCVGGGKTH